MNLSDDECYACVRNKHACPTHDSTHDTHSGSSGMSGIHGDERLDRWVRRRYGKDSDWGFISAGVEGFIVTEMLPDFLVLDDDSNTERGIFIHKKLPDIEACELDDRGDLCWQFDDIGWVSKCDFDHLDEAHVLAIENHSQFKGWSEKCDACCASRDNCECEQDDRDRTS